MRPRLSALLRHIWSGLGYVGWFAAGPMPAQYGRYVPDVPAEQPAPTPPATPSLPPAAHPERLVPDEPLTEEASELWAQLSDLDV